MKLTEFEKRILARAGQDTRAPAASDNGDGFEIIMRGPKGHKPDPQLVMETVEYMQQHGLMQAELKPYRRMKGQSHIPSRQTR